MEKYTQKAVEAPTLYEVEAELHSVSEGPLTDNEYHRARRILVQYLSSLCNFISDERISLPDAVEQVARCSDVAKRRVATIILARAAGISGVLSVGNSSNYLNRKLVELFEKNLPDISKKIFQGLGSQTFERYEAISNLNQKVVASFQIATSLPQDVNLLATNRTEIIKAISSDLNSAYLHPFDQKHIKASLNHIFSLLHNMLTTNDFSFATKLEELRLFLASEEGWCENYPTFFTKEFYLIILGTVVSAVTDFERNQASRFSCELSPKRRGQDIAEKQYPLHDTDRLVKVVVMLNNAGPGVALDAQAELRATTEGLGEFDSNIELGDINPGEYPFTFDLMVTVPVTELSFLITLSWSEATLGERKSKTCKLRLIGQNPDVNWKKLKTTHPYSTGVAEGDEFVGRTTKVQSLAARLLKERMVSSFITGQKRVGKSSLAHAVERYIKKENPFCHILYLEHGQYRAMDPVDTLEQLGFEIAEFLQTRIPHELRPKNLNFKGSLATLSKLSDLLIRERPSERFIFILDEFDDIPPEMYRFGALAETFFSNLRTLSTKQNVAFVLVGGEKMPFVMSAQGHQLNKFVSERLDSFVKGDEWADYVELVRKPVRNELNWSEESLQQVFYQTNGNPYFTKLLCAKIFTVAVTERDSEITNSDVRHGCNKIIPELESNVFAHLWKDGISEDRDKAKILELQRRRVLSACARTLRAREILNIESVCKHKAGLQIADAQVGTIFDDFVRRGIINDDMQHGSFVFSIPLFSKWLEEVGISQLMSDGLAEEYESAEQRAEDAARIMSAEIVSLTEQWPSYRGILVGNEAVRAWLDQVESYVEQRILFKLLQNLRFITRTEVREALKQAQNMLTEHLPPLFQEKKADRRKDMLVTWIDGPGKSGNIYAGLYAEQNKISPKCVCSPEGFSKALHDHEEKLGSSVRAIVIVDDLIGTGNTMAQNLRKFVLENSEYIKERKIRILVVVLTATAKGQEKVQTQIAELGIDGDLRVCEPLTQRNFAFEGDSNMWASIEEKAKAKELCQRLGAKVHRQYPLGYGNQGLLLVFPDTCPNNSLPLLHASSSGQDGWRPLFHRPKN